MHLPSCAKTWATSKACHTSLPCFSCTPPASSLPMHRLTHPAATPTRRLMPSWRFQMSSSAHFSRITSRGERFVAARTPNKFFQTRMYFAHFALQQEHLEQRHHAFERIFKGSATDMSRHAIVFSRLIRLPLQQICQNFTTDLKC